VILVALAATLEEELWSRIQELAGQESKGKEDHKED
jgi:hypothetical protein